MKVAQICTNIMSGSVGSIVRNICDGLEEKGHEYLICYGRGKKTQKYNSFKFNTRMDIYTHAFLARIFDTDGLHSINATKRLINKLIEFNPDVIHIHCLHGYYINYPLLFAYLKKSNIRVIWTMHDCWAFTGHCCYYNFIKCQKWKYGCNNCQQKKSYPKSIFVDASKRNYKKKKDIFTSLSNITIVTPSQWLKKELENSFFYKYNILVIKNGINLNSFKEVEISKKIFYKYSIDSKVKIILGVASVWDERKGFKDFLELSNILDDNYQIVIVGLSKSKIKNLPNKIIGIERTENIDELVQLYNLATVLFNTTYEDNYPTVNIEAIACGTPVVTYDAGGSGEIIQYLKFGRIIDSRDYDSLLEYIKFNENKRKSKNYTKRILSKEVMISKYINLYDIEFKI